jgi:hypothetical protein
MKSEPGFFTTLAVIAVLVALPVGGAFAAPPPLRGLCLTPSGSPIWAPVDSTCTRLRLAPGTTSIIPRSAWGLVRRSANGRAPARQSI